MPTQETVKVKICLVGEAAVGKTSLIRRYALDEFDDSYLSTLGAKVCKRELQVRASGKETTYNLVLLIWDIMGEKHIRDLLREAFFAGAQGIVAVCDLTRYSTLRGLDSWIQSVFDIAGEVPVIYAVNKADLKDEVLLLFGEEELEECVLAYEAPYYYTSAKTGENVHQVFEKLAEEIVSRRLSKDILNVET